MASAIIVASWERPSRDLALSGIDVVLGPRSAVAPRHRRLPRGLGGVLALESRLTGLVAGRDTATMDFIFTSTDLVIDTKRIGSRSIKWIEGRAPRTIRVHSRRSD